MEDRDAIWGETAKNYGIILHKRLNSFARVETGYPEVKEIRV